MDEFAAKRQALLESGVRMMDRRRLCGRGGGHGGSGDPAAPRDHSAGNTVVGEL